MDDSSEKTSSNPAPSPGRCVYGYALFLVSVVCLVLYLLWAFIPTAVIHSLGITYCPSKYWAIALPVYSSVLIALFGFLIYPSINMLFTPPLNHCSTIWDEHYIKLNPKMSISFNGIPPIGDLPLDFVSRELYLDN